MSVVVAVRRYGRVVVGADSIAVSGSFKNTISTASPKLWRHGDYVVGHCGSPRDRSLIQYAAAWPSPPAGGDDDFIGHIHGRIIPAVRAALTNGGAMQKEHEAERIGSSFIVSANGHIFSILGDFQVEVMAEPYAAIGGGREVAYGALAAMELAAPRLDAESMVRAALSATARHYTDCARPWVILDAAGSPKSCGA